MEENGLWPSQGPGYWCLWGRGRCPGPALLGRVGRAGGGEHMLVEAEGGESGVGGLSTTVSMSSGGLSHSFQGLEQGAGDARCVL